MASETRNVFQRLFTFLKVMWYVLSHANRYKEYISFAQAGEDRLLKFLFLTMGLNKISYLEIGTNNPVEINNTYLFYLGGSRGVCVEPNPELVKNIKRYRHEDVCVNAGIAGKTGGGLLDFYVFDEKDSEKGLSTFSLPDAEAVEATTDIKIAKVLQIPVFPINEILLQYFPENAPDLISVDVEGLDLEILQSLDFTRWRPIAICVETVNFTQSHLKIKNSAIINFMKDQEYFVYADTGINTIFADKLRFR